MGTRYGPVVGLRKIFSNFCVRVAMTVRLMVLANLGPRMIGSALLVATVTSANETSVISVDVAEMESSQTMVDEIPPRSLIKSLQGVRDLSSIGIRRLSKRYIHIGCEVSSVFTLPVHQEGWGAP